MDTLYSKWNEQDQRSFKEWLKNHLAFGPTTVIFYKKDGTERTMLCTTKSELVEAYIKKTERTPNTETCFVYDLEAKSWRSFRYDSVKEVSFTVG